MPFSSIEDWFEQRELNLRVRQRKEGEIADRLAVEVEAAGHGGSTAGGPVVEAAAQGVGGRVAVGHVGRPLQDG